jgi:hypothetical protein
MDHTPIKQMMAWPGVAPLIAASMWNFADKEDITFLDVSNDSTMEKAVQDGAKSHARSNKPWGEYCRAVLALRQLEAALEDTGSYVIPGDFHQDSPPDDPRLHPPNKRRKRSPSESLRRDRQFYATTSVPERFTKVPVFPFPKPKALCDGNVGEQSTDKAPEKSWFSWACVCGASGWKTVLQVSRSFSDAIRSRKYLFLIFFLFPQVLTHAFFSMIRSYLDQILIEFRAAIGDSIYSVYQLFAGWVWSVNEAASEKLLASKIPVVALTGNIVLMSVLWCIFGK